VGRVVVAVGVTAVDVAVTEDDVVVLDVSPLSETKMAKKTPPTMTKMAMMPRTTGRSAVKITRNPARQPVFDLSFCGMEWYGDG